MPEILEDAGLSPTAGAPKVAIAVKKGRSGLRILKFALEKEVPANGVVYLIHVLSPLRRIPNALGGWFPVEQVHPEMVKKYKKHRLLEMQKLLDQYQRVCDKKKIESIVCYSESDCVSKELVSQICRFGITKIILGASSQSVLSRALKKDSISTYAAKYSPGFCTVMIVNKGKLLSVKNAAPAPILQCSSPSSVNYSGVSLGIETLSEVEDASEDDSRTSFEVQDGEKNASFGVLGDISNSQRVSSDCTASFFQRALSNSKSNHEDCPGTPIQEAESIYGVLERRQDSHSSTFQNEAISRPSDGMVQQALLLADIDYLSGQSLAASGGTITAVSEVELLQKQLIEARICAERARTEADWQRRKAEAVLASAENKVMEHERHRIQALRKSKCAIQQATRDASRCRQALAALEVAMQDYEDIKRRLTEEETRHLETQMELDIQKEMADIYAYEAQCAKNFAEAERRKCEETLMQLEDMARKVEIECQLRREAEEITSQEVTANAAMGKAQHGYFKYSFQELQAATNNFNEENKLGEGRHGPVYKGKLHHMLVAIKVLAPGRQHSRQNLQTEVELLSGIRHPHVLMLLGACLEEGCIVYEPMVNGSLEDHLFFKNGTPPLPWYIRFRVCLEVATALIFLHSQPKPIVHRNLKPSKVLLDRHFVSKIGGFDLARVLPHNFSFSASHYKDSVPLGSVHYIDPDYQQTGVESCECDVYALGIVMLQLLTGRPAIGVVELVEEAERSEKLVEILDPSAGDWPLEETAKLACIGLLCTTSRMNRAKLEEDILPVLESIQAVAGVAAAKVDYRRPPSVSARPVIPSSFLCPILREIMEDPFVAADGFTYEYHAIKVWLQANNTSPMTNLRLDHKSLTPNYTLRSAIRDWHDKELI